jgi:hypothetical protein
VKHFLSKTWFRLSVRFVLLLLVTLLGFAWYFKIWSWRDWEIIQAMSAECHPVWRDLHWGRVQAGQNVDEVIAATKPVRVERYGDFVELIYQPGGLNFTGVNITAKKGRLVNAGAWSCTWNRVFFDEMTGDDWHDFNDAYEARWQPIRQMRLQEEAVERGREGN